MIVHHVRNSFRCLFVDQKTATLLDTTEVENESNLEDLIKERKPEKIISILPGSATICRTSLLPDTDDLQLHEALRLQAEARLLGGTPHHRRAVAAMESAAGESNRVGLIIAWPEETSIQIPEILHDASFIPETGAIAALFNGCRPTDPIVVADQTKGSVSLALTCPQGIAFRSTRENSASSDLFQQGTIRAVKETASLNKHTEGYTSELLTRLERTMQEHEQLDPLIIIPQEIIASSRTRLHNTQEDSMWWNIWGLAVGAALASIGPLSTLATMRFSTPIYTPSKIEQFKHSISQPKTAMRLGFAAILVLAIGPALFSGIRLALLEYLNPTIQTRYDEVVSARKKQIVYDELSNSAWPMSKLIADILNCTPQGIEIESLRLDVGEPVTIRGRAMDSDGHSAVELIAIMEDTLFSYRVFRDVKFSYDSAGIYGDRDFDISATVLNPLKRPRYTKEHDFGLWTLAMRRDGINPITDEVTEEGASDSDGIGDEPTSMLGAANVDMTPSPTTPAFVDSNEPRSDRPRRDRTADGGSDAGSRSGNRAASTVTSRLPEPLSAEQINVMTLGEAKIALKDVSQGLSRVGSDSDAKQRLRNEMRLLLDRMKAVNR